MRAHNVPEYPDPAPAQVKIGVPAGSPADAIKDTPRFSAAGKTCDQEVLGMKPGEGAG